MKKSRPLKELYVILLESYKKNVRYSETDKDGLIDYRYSFFLCNHINDLLQNAVITSAEKISMYKDFQGNRPTKTLHIDFYQHPLYYKKNTSYSWWKYRGKNYPTKLMDEKIRFIEHLVSIHSND